MMTDTAAAPSAEIILQGLAIVRQAGNLLLVAICPRKAEPIRGRGFTMPEESQAAADWALDLNIRLRMNLYFTVNVTPERHKKAAKTDMTQAVSFWSDCDPQVFKHGGYDKARDYLLSNTVPALQGKATYAIDSGNGISPFFELRDPLQISEDFASYEALNDQVGKAWSGATTHNCDRVMRLPGTWNYPNDAKIGKGYPSEPRLARLLFFGGPTYTMDGIREMVRRRDLDNRFWNFLTSSPAVAARYAGSAEGLADKSGSAMDFSMVSMLKLGGFEKDEARELLESWQHGSTTEQRKGDRYWERCWERTTPDSSFSKSGTSSAPEPEVTISDLEKQLLAFDAFADPFTPIAHFVDRWIPHNEVTLFAGHGGSGKSYVAMSLAIHVALGRPFCGLDTVAAPVLFFSGEDGAQVILRRFHSLCKALSVDPAELDGKLLLLDASDIDPALHRDARGVTETKLLGALSELVAKRNIGLVVVDNASDTFDDDEIKRARVRQFVRSLRSRIARPNRAVLLLAHVNKVSAISGREAGKEDYSGSTAWHNSVRSRLSLNVEKDENLMTIEHQKANLGPRAKPVRMRWHDGVPLQDGTFTDAGAAAAAEFVSAERVRANNLAKGILVSMLQDFNNRGETVTTSNTGGFSVWHLLSKRAGFPKTVKSASDLMDLLAELQAEGRIYRAVFRTKDRKMREVFVAGSAPMPDENDQKEGN